MGQAPEAETRPFLQFLDEVGIGADHESIFAHSKNFGGVEANDRRDGLQPSRPLRHPHGSQVALRTPAPKASINSPQIGDNFMSQGR